jgi:C1A family cysteine protease
LASGFPFAFGFSVYESFESAAVAKTGVVPMPSPDEVILGGHAVLAVGYDDSEQRFIVRNSWGDEWGDGGYFSMPYAFLTERNLSSDFWTIRVVNSSS